MHTEAEAVPGTQWTPFTVDLITLSTYYDYLMAGGH